MDLGASTNGEQTNALNSTLSEALIRQSLLAQMFLRGQLNRQMGVLGANQGNQDAKIESNGKSSFLLKNQQGYL